MALRWLERQRARVSHWVQRGVSRLAPELDVLEAACRAMRGLGNSDVRARLEQLMRHSAR